MFGGDAFGWIYFGEAFLEEVGPLRVSQVVAEAVESPTSGSLRTSQEVVEAVEGPTDASLRTSQEAVEVVKTASSPQVTSQVVVEYIVVNSAIPRSFGYIID